MSGDAHTCPVDGCTKQVPHDILMCVADWRLVPKPLQRAVYAAFDNGRGRGTPAHQAAMDAAIAAANQGRAEAAEQRAAELRASAPPPTPAERPDDAIPCESCHALILFVTVSNNQGKKPSKMPVDAEPNPEGNVAAFRDVHKRLVGRVLTAKQQPTPYETRYMPHFATCTAPEQHRRRQRGNWTSAVSARNADQRRGRSRRPHPGIGPGMTRLHPGRDNRP